MDKLRHYFNIILAIITFIMIVLIAMLNWGIVFFAIADWTTLHNLNSLNVYEILASFWLLLAIPSHVFCQIIMYDDKIYTLVVKWINDNSTKWLVIFTLSYINTYLLDWYFIKNKYTHDFTTYNKSQTESFWIIFPVLNLIVYYKLIKFCRKYRGMEESNNLILKLFFKGQLITYIIKKY